MTGVGTAVRAPVAPLARALTIVGDAWSVRIIRSVFVGRRTFGALRDGLGISDAVLSRRLSGLVAEGVLTHPSARPDAAAAREYRLTEEGKDLWRVLVAIRSWDEAWAGPGHPDSAIELHHHTCGRATHPMLGCGACGAIGVRPQDVVAHADDGLFLDVTAGRSRRLAGSGLAMDSTRVLGDNWATLVLACALMGATRFQDFERQLPIPAGTLTSRLRDFVDADVLRRDAHREGARRQVYRLTPRGLDFFAVAAMINDWSRSWLAPDGHSGLSLVHRACGGELQPQFTCNCCNGVLERTEVSFRGRNLEGAAGEESPASAR
ncbi:winged helix-turn-helix transcriptional regulator [Dietzia alimentaria]|uniref:winged helix-turn-helix transcriptional regulator n=1 Tax=Dietzia alimentaria TaxID=665550 RepID=UPI00029A22EA|nr:helix-turn-helix domain-containing protein [Dietzia alimentaria]